MIFSFLFSCWSQEVDPETAEKKATELALQQHQALLEKQPQAVKDTPKKSPVVTKVASDSEKLSNEPVEIVFMWDKINPLHQSFFSDSSVSTILSEGLIGLPSPVSIGIRWIPTSEAGDLGVGEIVLLYEAGVSKIEEFQAAADVLMKYRNEVGKLFDMRIYSFNLGIESIDCRVDIISKVSLEVALLSPCIKRGEESICATVTEQGMSYSPKMLNMISECFPE